MSNIYRTSLLPFRSRSQSNPTSPTPHSFSVDRASTIHTVFTMLDTDGCHDTKSRSPTMPLPRTASYTRNPRSIGMRRRFINLFTSTRTRKDSVSSTLDVSEATSPSSASTPIRFISPRATESVPSSSPQARQRTFSFVHRQGNRTGRISQDLTHQPIAEQSTPSGSHAPVNDVAYSSPMRNDSVASPSSPSKGAALTSHPISGLDEVFSESSERFETPMIGRSEVFDRK